MGRFLLAVHDAGAVHVAVPVDDGLEIGVPVPGILGVLFGHIGDHHGLVAVMDPQPVLRRQHMVALRITGQHGEHALGRFQCVPGEIRELLVTGFIGKELPVAGLVGEHDGRMAGFASRGIAAAG